MKRLIATVLVLVTILSVTICAQAGTNDYVTWSFSSLRFLNEIKDRIAVLAEKKEPTPIEVDLAFKYVDAFCRLMELSTTELAASYQTSAPEESDSLKTVTEGLERYRLFYELGIVNGSEVIKLITDGIFGE